MLFSARQIVEEISNLCTIANNSAASTLLVTCLDLILVIENVKLVMCINQRDSNSQLR